MVFLSEAFHPSRFPSCHLFSFISSSEFQLPSQTFLLLLRIQAGWVCLLSALSPVSLGAARCCALPADPGLVSKNPTGCWLEAAHPSVCSVGLGLRAVKDRFVGGGCWLSPGCPGASVRQQLPRGLLPRLSCFLLGAPFDTAASPGGWGRGRVGGGWWRQKVPYRSRDGLHGASTHARSDSCSVSPIRLQSLRWSRPAPPSSSRDCMSSQPATSSCTWLKVGVRACVHVCVTRGGAAILGAGRAWGPTSRVARACLLAARGLGGHCMGGVCPGFLSCSPADSCV